MRNGSKTNHRAPGLPAVLLLLALLCLLPLFPSQAASQLENDETFAGWTVVQVQRSGGDSFEALLFYPAVETGLDAPYDGSRAPYPAVSFGHGYQQPPMGYSEILLHLAFEGYLVIAPASGLELVPNHARFAQDMLDCLSYLEQCDTDEQSFLYGQVDTGRFGLSGHSMGGGAAILAAADPRIKGLATLAAAETSPSAIAAITEVQAPLALVAGNMDMLVPLETNSQAMYTQAQPPRLLQVIPGGYHCGFVNDPAYPSFCDVGAISLETQLAITCDLLKSFFGLYLKVDEDYWTKVWGPPIFLNPLVLVTADPGMVLEPLLQKAAGRAGESLNYEVLLRNTGNKAQFFDIIVDSWRWPAAAEPIRTAVLQPDEEVNVAVQVEIPPEAPNFVDWTMVSARSGNDGLTRQFSLLINRRLWR